MKRVLSTGTILAVALMVLSANLSVFGHTLHVISKEDYVTIVVGGFDEPTGYLNPIPGVGPITGPDFEAPLAPPVGPYEVLQWVNAAHPNSGFNEWTYTGVIDSGDWLGDVSGGTYDGAMDGSNPLLYHDGAPLSGGTSDAMWLLTPHNIASCDITVPSDMVAFSMKPDSNDGIANFIVDGIVVATIDMYHDDDAGFEVERDIPNIETNDYYLPIVVIVVSVRHQNLTKRMGITSFSILWRLSLSRKQVMAQIMLTTRRFSAGPLWFPSPAQ